MKIIFQGGLLDGHSEDVPDEQNWDRVGKVGVAGPSGRIVEEYLRYRIVLGWAASGKVASVTFAKGTTGLTIDPQETVRVIKLNASQWEEQGKPRL